MGIWIHEMADEVRREVSASLRDRRMLRLALEDRLSGVQDGVTPDCALVLFEACVRPTMDVPPDEAETLLHAEVARQVFPGFKLRSGQAAMVVPGPVDAERIRRMLAGMHRRLQRAAQDRLVLAFGIARALEVRRGTASWLALADLRLQAREDKLQLTGIDSGLTAVERRRRPRARPSAS
jgi:hypothetical protein